MYKLIFSLLLTTTFFTSNIYAYNNDFALKAGLVFSDSLFNKLDQDDDDYKEEEESKAFGTMTSFSYTWKSSELGIESRVTLGKEAQLSFSSEGQRIDGKGNIMSVDITPYIKVHSRTFNFPKMMKDSFTSINITPWYMYFKVGPSWMMQTIYLDNFNIDKLNPDFKKDHKITYESRGFSMSLGIEEDLFNKASHPCFFEVSVSAYESYKVSLVDTRDSKEINILDERDAKQDIKTYQLMFVLGMTLF